MSSALAVCLAWIVPAEPSAHAWEAATTHAGLTEQSALAAGLHRRLRDQLGLDRGLFTALTVPPKDAPPLFEVLGTLNPTHGYVPDRRGRMLALGWLTAGSVVADGPRAHAQNHFFDPATSSGLTERTLGERSVRQRIVLRAAGGSTPSGGVAAPDWVIDPSNPMNLAGFIDQYRKAMSAATQGERDRHAAGALLAAGAILHVLQDMGSPSHVRNDAAAHLDKLGSEADLGSRFERVAALAFGRLGVPAPGHVVEADSLRAFFTSKERTGLADWTEPRFFSPYTLPDSFAIRGNTGAPEMASKLAASLRRPNPAPLPTLNLDAARSQAGIVLHDDNGVCLARYRVVDNRLSWSIDDACLAEQAAVILPEVVAYSAGLLSWLFRGQLELQPSGKQIAVVPTGAALGAGTLQVYWDDSRGVRTPLGAPIPIENGAIDIPIAQVAWPPRGAMRVAALFHGVDPTGEPLVAAVTSPYPLPKPAEPAKP